LEASITLKSLAKKYNDDVILADLSLGIESRSNHVLIGENGAGKSTVLRILIGLIEKDAGFAYIQGKDISNRGPETRMVTGYMPQYIDLDNEINIYENLFVFSELYGVENNEAEDKIMKYADIFDFKKDLLKHPGELSKGTLRSIQFTRSILHDPEVLLLDEPTTFMDPINKMKFWDLLDRIGKDKTLLFTTQDFNEAEKYADRISILHNGNIRMDGSLDKLIGTTKGIAKYQIRFKEHPSNDIIDKIKELPKILKPIMNGNNLDFYATERKDFFHVLRIAIDCQIDDIDMGFCSLIDLYLGLIGSRLE